MFIYVNLQKAAIQRGNSNMASYILISYYI